jgi:hypothetical protein
MNELLAKPKIAGIVVTHGTSTSEETAYFLDLTTASSKPVRSQSALGFSQSPKTAMGFRDLTRSTVIA